MEVTVRARCSGSISGYCQLHAVAPTEQSHVRLPLTRLRAGRQGEQGHNPHGDHDGGHVGYAVYAINGARTG